MNWLNKKIQNRPIVISSCIALLSLFFSSSLLANIDIDSMHKDITFLSSDKLKGRAVFTKEIDLAADYIAKRFKSIGLTPFENNRFVQSFHVHKITNNVLQVNINGQQFTKAKTAIVSNQAQLNWQKNEQVHVTYIKKNDDLFSVLGELNIQGGNHLVLVHSQHKVFFERYKKHFDKGTTKLSIDEPATMVIVLSRISEINTFDITADNKIVSQSLSNVVGVLPGNEKPNEIIIFSAHYDHLGTMQSTIESYDDLNQSDTIFNGADDDASGTTAVIQLAEYFALQAKTKANKRTLLFTAFTAEEIGGYGSQYFSKHIAAEKIKAMINIEMIGKPSKFGDGTFWMTGFERSDIASIMNETLMSDAKDKSEKDAKQVYADPYPEQKLFYRSDNATLARLGVPAHSFSSTQLDKDPHYHQTSDELSTLNLTSMAQVINGLAQASKSLINGNKTPSRVDISKVKPSGKLF